MKEVKKHQNTSLTVRLILAFILTSIIPIILSNLISYYNTSGIVKDNMQELTKANLRQTDSSLTVWLESYEDILSQIYTDDDIVAMIDKINRGEDSTVTKNQLRRTLGGLFYTKEYIKSITIITDSGAEVFYDRLTGSSTRNSWMDNLNIPLKELYQEVSGDNKLHILSTQEAIHFGVDAYYLFHLGHRVIDYRNVEKQLGIVIVSVEEELLQNVCNGGEDVKNGFNFIVDRDGAVVSYPDKEMLSTRIIQWRDKEEERRFLYGDFIKGKRVFGGKYIAVDSVYNEKLQWDIVNVSSQNEIVKRLNDQQKITLLILSLSLLTLIFIIAFLIRSLTGSLQELVGVMKRAGRGELWARVRMEKSMPSEVEVIAVKFNYMLGELEDMTAKEKEAGEKQKAAEIAALEAQTNPHFLYNTLDTINWMAIDKDEYEISNAINALAVILRYSINNSNGVVTVWEECEWLKKYLFLQQTRLKNTFECEIDLEMDVKEYRIHKLLLQPFVENSILHGFEGVKRLHRLTITITEGEGRLLINIYDNGKGIDGETVRQMNLGIFPKCEVKNHIGMENAISRIKMYYGETAKVRIESAVDEFTRIYIEIPADWSKCESIT